MSPPEPNTAHEDAVTINKSAVEKGVAGTPISATLPKQSERATHNVVDSNEPPSIAAIMAPVDEAKGDVNGHQEATVRAAGVPPPSEVGSQTQDTAETRECAPETSEHDLQVKILALSLHDEAKSSEPISTPTITKKSEPRTPTPPPPPPKDDTYLKPVPRYSTDTVSDSEASSTGRFDAVSENGSKSRSWTPSEVDGDEKFGETSLQGNSTDSRSEIQTIMGQFDEEGGGPGIDEVMSPRLELAGPILGGAIQHPPRKSSLEPTTNFGFGSSPNRPHFPPLEGTSESSALSEKSPPHYGLPNASFEGEKTQLSPESTLDEGASLQSINSTTSLHRPPPPEPEPEPDLPFDFHRFLEQLRHRSADPVAKFLRSFLMEFGKKQWMVHEQVKIISDFLAFIANKMAMCEVWRGVSDAEFDNAREGMEKLVMNRLYTQTFSPAIPPPQPIPRRTRSRNADRAMGPGRRGQHQEDVERDAILAQKVRIYGWVREEHLDIKPVGDTGKRFLSLAQQELLKINSYRAPRDKVICVLNCCKVIFGLLRHSNSDSSADSFIPLIIYVVLQANPEHLVSNVQYILRFRNQEKLGGEAGYYLSSLTGAIQFIETLDRTTLTISDEEFEKNVEAAVSAIAEKHQSKEMEIDQSEKPNSSTRLTTPRSSSEAEAALPRTSTSSRGGASSFPTPDGGEDRPVGSLLRTIQKPLSSIGRIFSEEAGTQTQPPATPPPYGVPSRPQTERSSTDEPRRGASLLSEEDAAARQASLETAEAQRLQRIQHADVVETLSGMFPDLDKDVISDVVRMKDGRVGLAVDACLSLSS